MPGGVVCAGSLGPAGGRRLDVRQVLLLVLVHVLVALSQGASEPDCVHGATADGTGASLRLPEVPVDAGQGRPGQGTRPHPAAGQDLVPEQEDEVEEAGNDVLLTLSPLCQTP